MDRKLDDGDLIAIEAYLAACGVPMDDDEEWEDTAEQDDEKRLNQLFGGHDEIVGVW